MRLYFPLWQQGSLVLQRLQLTVAVIKPHVLKAPHALQDIRERILNNSFYVLKTKRTLLSQRDAERLYSEHKEKFFFWRLATFMCSGYIDVHILARENAIQHWRQLMGPTKTFRAQFSAPRSIRGSHGLSDTRNAVHGSGGAAVALSVICLPFVTPALRRICLPYVPATEQQLSNVVQAIKAPTAPGTLADGCLLSQARRKLVDLGSGDGRVVEVVSRQGIPSLGVELNLWLVLYSRIRALWLQVHPKPRYVRTNLWKFSLRDFSDVVIFGVEPMMAGLEKKFQQELVEGSRVVACRFPLPTWRPIATFGCGVDTVWLYQVGNKK